MFDNKKVHMIGIGGVSMSGIAEILLSYGCTVTGYDAKSSEYTEHLMSKGVEICFESNLKNVEDADLIVYTAAIKEDNPELKHAREIGKDVYERGVFFGLLMKNYKNVLCISGTHGKSTTTGMVSTIFLKAKKDPTIQIGAILPIIGGNDKVGSKEYFVAEACEYVESYLNFFPTAEIILNIDDDHLDYFKNIDNIKKSFNKYTKLLPKDGILVINNDDNNTIEATSDFEGRITYGINNNSMYMAKNIVFNDLGHPTYDLYINGEYKIKVNLEVSGNHNVYNSLAAISLSNQYIDDLNVIVDALKEYHGVGRRFEYIGKYHGANIFDDYAHHPSEILTTYNSVKGTKHKRNIAVFQSHTYSRTKDHLKEFGEVLAKFDNIVIAPIYAAREENIYNVSENDIIELIKSSGNNNVIYIDSFDKIVDYLKDEAKEDDLIITIGAGPINEVGKRLVSLDE